MKRLYLLVIHEKMSSARLKSWAFFREFFVYDTTAFIRPFPVRRRKGHYILSPWQKGGRADDAAPSG